jgi:Insect cuticle protein
MGLLAAPQQVGFGDATDAEIAEIRAGTYLETFDDNPQYNFNYKISDETEQTYVAMDETRDGESVTGSYSYVDPTGALITVNYVAGPDGYTETRDVQENFIQIRPRPVRPAAVAAAPQFVASSPPARPTTSNTFTVVAPSSSSSSQFASSSSSSLQSDIVSQVVSQVQPLISQTVSTAVAGASRRPAVAPATPAPVRQQQQVDIVSQVVSEIQPLLSQTVSSAIAGSGNRFTTASRPAPVAPPAPRAPAPAPRPVAQASRVSGSVTDLFGSSGDFNVRFNTPSFKIEY